MRGKLARFRVPRDATGNVVTRVVAWWVAAVDWGVPMLRRLAAVGVVAALLLSGGCASKPKKHQILYSIDLTQPDDVTTPVYFLNADGLQSVVATFPWSTRVTLEDQGPTQATRFVAGPWHTRMYLHPIDGSVDRSVANSPCRDQAPLKAEFVYQDVRMYCWTGDGGAGIVDVAQARARCQA